MPEAAQGEVTVCRVADLADPDSREFQIGDGEWPFRGFIVRRGGDIFAYRNFCLHAGHPLNWYPDRFLTDDGAKIICASHGAIYRIDDGECVAGPCVGAVLQPVTVEIVDGQVVVRGPTSVLGIRGA